MEIFNNLYYNSYQGGNMMPEDIEKLFIEDCISKKLISKGVHNRAARRKGFRGKVMFPVDLLKGKEKKAYMGNSDVVTYNLYDNIMPYDDFKKLDKDEKRKVLSEYLKRFSREEIISVWNVSKQTIYDLTYKLSLTQKRIINVPSKEMVDKKVAIKEKKAEIKKTPTAEFNISLSGNMPGKQIKERLSKILEFIEDNQNFSITFEIKENF